MKIHVSNFRNFISPFTFELKTFNLIYGSNGAGKSSLLDLQTLAYAISQTSLSQLFWSS